MIKSLKEKDFTVKFPTIIIVFNNLDRFSAEVDSDDDEKTTPESWLKQIRNITREFLARKIEEYIHNNKFDFDDIYFRKVDKTTSYKKDIQQVLEKLILPDNHFFTQAKGNCLTEDDSGQILEMI